MTSLLSSLRLPNGLEIEQLCPANTMIAYQEIFREKIYRRSVAELRPGSVVFDVGANVGLFTLFLNTLEMPLTVHCFEPIPATFAALEANIRRHDRLAAILHQAGAADRAGTTEFTFYPKTSTSSSMYPDETAEAHAESNAFISSEIHRRSFGLTRWLPARWIAAWAERIRRDFQRSSRVSCRLVRLSDVVREARLDRLDLLKVDVEGAEFDCLEGIDDDHWPLIQRVIIEVHGGAEDRTRMEQLLERRGLTVERTYQQLPDIFSRHYLIEAARPTGPLAKAGEEAAADRVSEAAS
jgi:FkbM family methyltransferase